MPSSVNTTNRIPGNGVILSLGNGLITVRANPTLIIVSIGSRGGLNRIFNTAFYFNSLDADSNSI